MMSSPFPKPGSYPFAPGDARAQYVGVKQYLQMVRAGDVNDDDPLELLEGALVTKMGKNPRHVLAGKRIFRQLAAVVPAGWHVAKQDPIETVDSVPEPDLTVVRGMGDDYRDRLPRAAEVALVVEIAYTNLARDQLVRARLYARAGIPVYWYVNVWCRQLELHCEPTGPGPDPCYQSIRKLGPGERVGLAIDGQEVAQIDVASLLP
jgi:Uma2 family endonuclease